MPLLGHALTIATDLLGWILWAHLTVLIETARLFSGVPGAALTLPPLPPLVALPAYLGLAGLAWRLRRRPGAAPLSTMGSGGWALLALVGCLVAGVVGWNLIATRPPAAPALWLPSVMDGRLALLRLPTGATVLIDGGATHTAAVQLLGRALPFWQRRVDIVIATDPRGRDSDRPAAGPGAVSSRPGAGLGRSLLVGALPTVRANHRRAAVPPTSCGSW